MTTSLEVSLATLLDDPARVSTVPQVVSRLSKDFYWYSPVLRKQLEDKVADVVVYPLHVTEIQDVLRYCYAHDIPVTPRGAGTGNYGQAVPLHGGVLLDLSRMDAIESITEDGIAICQPGVRLGALENEARMKGWELRCYPSTIVKASVGGFLAGGSGGIGSVSHGGLRDFETVRALDVVTMEEEPRLIHREGQAVHDILHAWGTNGIITRISLALTPSVEWAQCAAAFDTFEQAFDFSERIAGSPEWTKRLVTVFEWPIPSFLSPIRNVVREGKALVFLMIAEQQRTKLEEAVREAGASVTFSAPYIGLRSMPLLSDYTWNHTTLWAMKADPGWTYLQCGFDPVTARSQFAKLKQRFGDEFLFHLEFMKNGQGTMIPGSIPVVRFSTEERLNEMIDYCREIGVGVANPHVNNVEGGGRYSGDNVQLMAKYRYDSKGLLNPGKMVTFEKVLA
jgi:FAD/FMN-containing dehydrogenase